MKKATKDQTKIDIARCEWRAELCEFAAAVAAEAGDTKANEVQSDNAVFFRLAAKAMRDYLDVAEKAKSRSPEAQEAAGVLREHRAFWRTLAGVNAPAPLVLDEFWEPSKKELLERFN